MLFEDLPPASYADLVSVLADRLRIGLDRTVAVGFRGSFHPLLALREVERDLRWAVRDPWGGGTDRVVRTSTVAIFPFHPDFGRPGMLPAYRAAGFDTAVFLCRPSRVTRYAPVLQEPESGLRLLPVIRASADTPAQARTLSATAKGPGARTFFLLFDGKDRGAEAARALLARLSRRHTLRFHALPAPELPSQTVTTAELAAMADVALPCTPGARHQWLSAEPLRRSARNADARALLGALAHRTPGLVEVPAGELPIPTRLHTSVMPGLVTLSGASFDVRLDGGALAGISRRGEPLFPLAKLRSYITVGRAVRPFTVLSAASFEDGPARGLRAAMSVEGGALVVDYAFVDRCDALLVDVHASYPALPAACSAVVPFALAIDLPPGTDGVKVQCLADDAVRREITLPAGRRSAAPETAAGTAFVIETGGQSLCLSFPERRGLTYRPLQCMVVQDRGTRVLLLNPLGTFHPAEAPAYSSMREQLTLLLSPSREPPRLSRAVLKRCTEHRVLRAADPSSRPLA